MGRVTMAVFAIASLAAEAAVADDEGPPTAEPTAPPVAEPLLPPVTESAPEASSEPVPLRWIDRVTLSGGVDGYVALPLRGGLREPSALRAFDAVNGSFTLAYAELAVAVAPAPAGLRLDLGFGPVADLSSLEVTTDPGPPPTTTTGASEVMKHVQQAYVSLELPGPRSVVVDAGRFVTSAGAEVIEAKDDWLYSRSLLFGYAIPFAHNGVRITAASGPTGVQDGVAVVVGATGAAAAARRSEGAGGAGGTQAAREEPRGGDRDAGGSHAIGA